MAERTSIPTPPLCVIPATNFLVQPATGIDGPCVMLELHNAVFHTNFPMDLEQAEQHIENVRRAILEAQGLALPGAGGIIRP